MPLRALMIDDAARAEANRVIAYAMDHPFVPGVSPTPGDDPRFVADFGTYRAVFTFTRHEGKTYRQLSISIPAPGMYPNVVAAFMIAELFGFTGYDHRFAANPGRDWMIDVRDHENAVG